MPRLAIPLGSAIAESTRVLRAAQVSEPRRQALRIWSEVSGAGMGASLLEAAREIPAEQVARYRRAVERRARGEPLAHVTESAGFRHLILKSDRRALIPRPETEGLVELLLQRVGRGVVADVGTGTGCIALSLAREGNFDSIIALDCSAEALELARENAVSSSRLLRFVRADLLSCLAPESLDALISNPPYLTDSEYEQLDSSVREWEPALALKGGLDGLGPTTRLLRDGRTVLRAGGWLALEVDCTRAEAAGRMASEYGWRDVSLHQDLFGRERYLLARRSETL